MVYRFTDRSLVKEGEVVFTVNLKNENYDRKFGIYQKMDNGRACVEMNGTVVKIQPQKLLIYNPLPTIDDSLIIEALKNGREGVHHMVVGRNGRVDIQHRILEIQNGFKLKSENPQFDPDVKLTCLDMGPPRPDDKMWAMLNEHKFPCRGDGLVNFRRFGQGIDFPIDSEDFREQVMKRVKEYFISGMCERCQIMNFECGDYLDDQGPLIYYT
ncbi:hypothetical protein MP228_001005 [Amoeboaphelidium protococcarum]|nr:hypothetical protein MP228_001005 [Amoeboaphelidium protococcarum]